MNIKSRISDEGSIKGVHLLAQDKGENIGFLVGEITPGATALIENVNVQPSHRNMGVGSALVTFFNNLAGKYKCQVEGDFRPDSTIREADVQRFYENRGLKVENGKISPK